MFKIVKIFIAVFIGLFPGAWAMDSMDFDDIAIVDGEEADIQTEEVFLNNGAEVANVGEFDLGGVMLGMSYEDIHHLFFSMRGLYTPRKKDSVIYSLHQDWKANLDYECRQQGTVIPAELEKCIRTLARNRGLLYVSEIHLERENTGETLVVYFTSNATDNRVWRAVYKNDVAEQEGADEKFIKQRDNKILVFWQSVLDKYGAPNAGTDHWISSTNSYDPMLIADYGVLELVDRGREASDQVKNIQTSRENFKAKPYAF